MLNKESNYLTNQELIRLINVLRSMVVKCWTVDDFDNKDDRKYNKLIIKWCRSTANVGSTGVKHCITKTNKKNS